MDSKNTIKKRMISIAAKAWGVTGKDIEKTDPIVPLLIDACASEIVRINSSVSGSRDKMGQKIMELLTPMELTSPYPARAIMNVMPMDSFYELDEKNEFYFEKRIILKDEAKDIDIFFTPTGSYKLIKGEVRYLACCKSIIHKTGPFETQDFCKANAQGNIEPNTFWIGLHVTKPIKSLDGVSFYFDFDMENISELEEDMFYYALSKSQWEINGNKIIVSNGYKTNNKDISKVQYINSISQSSKSGAICNHINNFYEKKFYTIREEESNTSNHFEINGKYPDEFTSIFSEDDLNEIESNILWIKINFSQYVPSKILGNIDCSINCFPVINRRAEKVFITGKDKIRGLVSEDNEMFFDLKNFSSDGNLKIFLDSNKVVQEEGTALLALRQDNIGRFNSRNALELIQQMIDSYREEFQAFSKFKNINQDSVEDLSNAIRPFEDVLEELYDVSFDSMPYIMLKTSPENENEHVQVNYWLTNGSLANDIDKEENLRYDSAELMKGKVLLMTTTAGGMDRKRNEELTNDFRYALLTRDRIVTKGDIKALCYKIFDGLVEDIEVKEGITTSSQPNSGMRRSINILIKLTQTNQLNKESIKFLKEDLMTRLKEKSSNILPFTIHIHNY
ncbi:MAG: hypothetical protein K8S16_07305 [Bacteroidales bacterium]|nr:hypothetical protein [Bacteroidales bacterium]